MQRNQMMYALAFGMAMATAYAASQEPAKVPAEKPAAKTTAKPAAGKVEKKTDSPAATEKPGNNVTTQASTGSAAPPPSPAPVLPVSAPPLRLPVTGLSSVEIQQRIQKALAAEPSLAGSSLSVAVTDSEISLSGSVGNGKERISARRIAQSFGGNRKFKENVTVNTPARAPGAEAPKPLEKKNPGVSGSQPDKPQNGLLENAKSGR